MNNIIEEYLVKIGALADARSFQNAQNLVNGLSGSLSKLGSILRYGGILGMFAGLTKGIADQIKSVAELDMQYQKLAKDMWVTKETAKSLTVIKDVMKATENDIAFIPELREQFMRLRAEMQALATPPDADDQLKWVRSIGYEVESLQVKLKMFREWLVYYLIKYLGPYIKQFQQFLQWLNGQFGEKIAIWANKLAYILARIVSLLVSAGRAVKWFVGGLWDFFDALPEKTKKMVLLFSAAGAAIMMSPFGMLLVAIGGALLLLEDFFYFLDGKKSSRTLAPIWAALVKFGNGTGKDILDTFKKGISDIYDVVSKFISELKIVEVISAVGQGVGEIAGGLFEVAKGIGAVVQRLTGGKPKVESFFGGFADYVSKTIKRLGNLAGSLGKIFKAVGKALQGDFSGAWDLLKEGVASGIGTIKEQFKDMWSRLPFGGNSSAVDRARQIVSDQPIEFLGNNNGCTYFVQGALGKDDEFIKSLKGDLYVPNWVTAAQKQGRYVEGTEGMQAGDIIVYDYGKPGGFGDHVVLSDGKGGAYGNSSRGANSLPMYYEDMNVISGPNGRIAGYIRTGGAVSGSNSVPGIFGPTNANGAGNGFSGFYNPNSYGAQQKTGTFEFPSGGFLMGGTNSTNYSIGNIVIYSNDPRTAGQSVFDEINKRSGSRPGVIK